MPIDISHNKESKGQQRARQILAVAREVLVKEGAATFSLRKVAQEAGIPLGNLQYYYPTKIELVKALFESSTEDSLALIQSNAELQALEPLARLLKTVEHFLEIHQEKAQQIFLRELWALAAHDDDIAAVMNSFYGRWVDLVSETVLSINPNMDKAKAQRRALLIISLVDGLSLFHGAVGIEHKATKGIEAELQEVINDLILD